MTNWCHIDKVNCFMNVRCRRHMYLPVNLEPLILICLHLHRSTAAHTTITPDPQQISATWKKVNYFMRARGKRYMYLPVSLVPLILICLNSTKVLLHNQQSHLMHDNAVPQ